MTKQKKKDTREKIWVRATSEGFFGGVRRRKGATFQVPVGVKGKWFEPTDPTLAAINAQALEDAEKAKAEAQKTANQKILEADQAAKESKAAAAAELQEANKNADEKAKKSIFGGLFGGAKTGGDEQKPAEQQAEEQQDNQNTDAAEGGEANGNNQQNVEDLA